MLFFALFLALPGLASCFILDDNPEDTDRVFSNFVPIFDDDSVGISHRYRSGRELVHGAGNNIVLGNLGSDHQEDADTSSAAIVSKSPIGDKKKDESESDDGFVASPVDEMAERIGKVIMQFSNRRHQLDREEEPTFEEPAVLIHNDGQVAEFVVRTKQSFAGDPPVVATHQAVHRKKVNQALSSTTRQYGTMVEVVSPSIPESTKKPVEAEQTTIPHREIERTERPPKKVIHATLKKFHGPQRPQNNILGARTKEQLILPHRLDPKTGQIILPHHRSHLRKPPPQPSPHQTRPLPPQQRPLSPQQRPLPPQQRPLPPPQRRPPSQHRPLPKQRKEEFESQKPDPQKTRTAVLTNEIQIGQQQQQVTAASAAKLSVSPHELAKQANQWLLGVGLNTQVAITTAATTPHAPSGSPPKPPSADHTTAESLPTPAFHRAPKKLGEKTDIKDNFIAQESQSVLAATSSLSTDLGVTEGSAFPTERFFDTLFRGHVENEEVEEEEEEEEERGRPPRSHNFDALDTVDTNNHVHTLFRENLKDAKQENFGSHFRNLPAVPEAHVLDVTGSFGDLLKSLPTPQGPVQKTIRSFGLNHPDSFKPSPDDGAFRPSMQIPEYGDPGEAIFYSSRPLTDEEFTKVRKLESNFLAPRSLVRVDQPVSNSIRVEQQLTPPFNSRRPRRNYQSSRRLLPPRPATSRLNFPTERIDSRIDTDVTYDDTSIRFEPSMPVGVGDFNPLNLKGELEPLARNDLLQTGTTTAETTKTVKRRISIKTSSKMDKLAENPRWPFSDPNRRKVLPASALEEKFKGSWSGNNVVDLSRVSSSIPKAVRQELEPKDDYYDYEDTALSIVPPPSILLPPLPRKSPALTAQSKLFGGSDSADKKALLEALIKARQAGPLPGPLRSPAPPSPPAPKSLSSSFKIRHPLFGEIDVGRYVDQGYKTVSKWLPSGFSALWMQPISKSSQEHYSYYQ
jgi:hypothetical protein